MRLKNLIGFPCSSLFLCLFASYTATAQIVPDNTLGNESSVVVPNQNIRNINSDRIDGGAVRGSNLFHSFREFNIDEGRAAYFSNPDGIVNILTRVTGENVSNILGRLGVLGNANLFLINPNGIIFGENASLDIGGSFFATSADSIIFANGSEFSATNPNTPPLLTINIPVGLWFRENPGRLVNRSQAVMAQMNEAGETFNIPVGLQVPPGQTLALVGGEVRLEGGILTTQGGRVELGSVAGNNFIALQPIAEGFALDYSGVSSFQNVNLSEFASVNTSGEGGGEIQIQGRQVSLTGNSAVISETYGSKAGGDVRVVASESVTMSGDGTRLGANTFGTGTGGNSIIETGRLIIRDGAFVAAPTSGDGNAGNLMVRASEAVELVGTNSIGEPSGLFGVVSPDVSGQGGTITVETGQLLIRDGGQISVGTSGLGQGGNLIVKASESVELMGEGLMGPSGLSAATLPTATGDGGTIMIETGRLIVRDGAQVGTVTFGSGNAGELTVKASESIELIGTTADAQFPSALSVQVEPGATGNGGILTVETGQLTVLDGAQIASGTAGSEGQGATVTINANSILVSGTAPVEEVGVRDSSGIFVTAEPVERDEAGEPRLDESGNPFITGADAGQLTINATELIVEDGAKVSAENFGTGLGGNATLNVDRLIVRSGGLVSAGSLIEEGVESVERGPGGTLTINASESVEVTGTGNLGSTAVDSRLVAESQGTGDAGDLNIFTPNLTVSDEAEVTVSATGTGEAGSLRVNADNIRLDNASLSAETRLGTEGNITIDTSDIRLRRGGAITTNSLETGTGGNITINGDQLIAIENSDISANALAGSGGQVIINVDAIFGTEFRTQQTGASDITATSELGAEFSGTVELNNEIDPAQGLVDLPQTVVDPAALIAQDPCKQRGTSEFVITGRGGIAPNPVEDSSAIPELVELESLLIEPVTPQPNNSSQPRQQQSQKRENNTVDSRTIVPARGWIRTEDGEVILVGYDPTQAGVIRQHRQLIQCHPKPVE
ncbi:MAG: S-layer family protein [Lyngbya sp.]|nr:S-layer family protein [Lyngbya sp.]